MVEGGVTNISYNCPYRDNAKYELLLLDFTLLLPIIFCSFFGYLQKLYT
jgi:hypothetical protein